jgi:hypothetical protein
MGCDGRDARLHGRIVIDGPTGWKLTGYPRRSHGAKYRKNNLLTDANRPATTRPKRACQ